jgi:hypothetical protein
MAEPAVKSEPSVKLQVPIDYFTVDLVVDGEKLPKILDYDTIWVIARFNHAGTKMLESNDEDPHGEKFVQKWPATPYTVRVESVYPGPVEATVWVDGKLACRHVLSKDKQLAFDFRGWASSPNKVPYIIDTVKEFLFTVPQPQVRRAVANCAPVVEEVNRTLGTVTVVFRDLDFVEEGVTMKELPEEVAAAPSNAPAIALCVSKGDAHHAKASSATAAGAPVARDPAPPNSRRYLKRHYKLADQISQTTLRYATKEQLQQKDILPRDDAHRAVPRLDRMNAKHVKINTKVSVDTGVISLE